MMMNLFSLFDPSTSFYFSFNWFSPCLLFMLLPYQFWTTPSRLTQFYIFLINYMFNEFKSLVPYSRSNLMIFISLLMFIFFNNFMGLFPYIFTASSHMSFCLSLSLNFWLSMMIYSTLNFINNFMAHLTPLGTPILLMPFMVIIESISLLIRPFTLAIRLTANMIAGHLLLSLLGMSGLKIHSSFILIAMIFIQMLLFMLEISVSIIQAYVFSILSTLYSSES